MNIKRINFFSILLLISILILSSCNIYKQIPNDKSILVNNQINILGQETDLINDFFYKDDIYKIPLQKPNKKIFGLPISQHIWAFYNQRKVTQFSQMMKSKIGNSPEFYDQLKLEKSKLAFENYYFNLGHFDQKIETKIVTKKKRTEVIYNIYPMTPYRIKKIYFDTISDFQKEIFSENNYSYLVVNEIFNINNFINEIDRLTNVANDRGYFTFNKEYVKFVFDTFKSTKELDVYIKILEEDSVKFEKYTIDSILVFIDKNTNVKKSYTTSTFNNIRFIQPIEKLYNDKFISKFIIKDTDSFYSKNLINQTIQKFSELNNFKLINSNVNLKSKENRVLDLYYALSPYDKHSFSFGQFVYNSTLGYVGTSPTITYQNKNLTKRADRFNLSLSSSFEFNFFLNDNKNVGGLLSRTDLTLSSTYSIEHFLLPFLFSNKKKYLYNRTVINNSFSYFKRLGYYDIYNFNSSSGFEWAKKRTNQFSYFPLVFNFILIPKNSISDEFNSTLNNNPYLKSTFTNTFILGSSFQFSKFHFFGKKKENSFNYKLNIETAGNSAYIIDKIIPLNRDNQNININGIDVSQFVKSQIDFGLNKKISQTTSLHNRLKLGLGLPFGNSTFLPYIKQFFIGGPNSIRAFQTRTIGPGNYNPNTTKADSNSAKDQLGNLLIEFSTEYRFDLISIFKGAVFLDAGNIWNTKESYGQSELSVFKFEEFYKQLYIGTGVGLRMDWSYVNVRFDIGVPLRVPYLLKNDWVIKDAKPLNSKWIGNNLILNIAVGYPF